MYMWRIKKKDRNDGRWRQNVCRNNQIWHRHRKRVVKKSEKKRRMIRGWNDHERTKLKWNPRLRWAIERKKNTIQEQMRKIQKHPSLCAECGEGVLMKEWHRWTRRRRKPGEASTGSATDTQTETWSEADGTRVTSTSELDRIQIKRMLTRLYKMVHWEREIERDDMYCARPKCPPRRPYWLMQSSRSVGLKKAGS